MIRATTNGVLKGYRSDLMSSFIRLNSSRDTVLTHRNFNTFAEDPAAAAQCFQLRRSYLRVESQHTISNATIRKFEVAYSSLESVVNLVDNQIENSSFGAILRGENDPTASGRTALGQELEQLAESIVQSMNAKYGDTYTFAGADGLKVPFTWENGDLYYRGVAVDSSIPDVELDATTEEPVVYNADGTVYDDTDPAQAGGYYKMAGSDELITIAEYDAQKADYEKLAYLENERRYVDIGIGLQEDENSKLIESSAFNDALQGIDYLGFGKDADGDPKNVVSLVKQLGEILSRCDENTGDFATKEDEDDFYRMAKKFEIAADHLKKGHVELTTEANFLKENHTQLETTAYTLNEQIMGIEQVDLADAITAYSWAQYCYNAALKVGNSILSESLMDYMSL